MSEYRAILVSRDQRDDLYNTASEVGDTLADAFDAAGDRPRIQWCAEHGAEIATTDGECWLAAFGHDADDPKPCRAVDAIVVPLPEQT